MSVTSTKGCHLSTLGDIRVTPGLGSGEVDTFESHRLWGMNWSGPIWGGEALRAEFPEAQGCHYLEYLKGRLGIQSNGIPLRVRPRAGSLICSAI